MILVTGATGNLGSTVIGHLLKNGASDRVAALVRNESKAAALKEQNVDIRIGNFDEPVTLENAMRGVEKLLLISTTDMGRFQQHKNVVDAAKNAGVKHIVYTGVSLENLDDSNIKELMESHFQTEEYIKNSGLTYTFLRNSLYMEVIPMFVGEKVFETGIHLPAGQGKVPFALRREMGEAAANVLLNEGHANRTYEIASNELYSFDDVAAVLSDLSQSQVSYTDVEADGFKAQLKQFGLPDEVIYLVTGFSADIKAHQFERTSNDLENLLGRRTVGLKEALKELYKL